MMLAGKIPPERLHLGRRLTGFADRGDRVELQFAGGEEASADIVIGADGIDSTVRELLFGPERPRFTGCVAYRGLVPAERLVHLNLPREAQIWMGPGKHFVHYPVSAGRLINFVCLIDRDAWTKESWTEPGNVADALAAYEGWHAQVRSIISSVTETFVWGLFDRAPLARWSVGRVTLLGDACHSTLPFMAQGAVMAIEDGFILARCLRLWPDDPASALRRYEAARRERANSVVRQSTRMTELFHNPELADHARARAFMARQFQPEQTRERYEWLFSYDATAVAV
jgi:salicylate hydroxylase